MTDDSAQTDQDAPAVPHLDGAASPGTGETAAQPQTPPRNGSNIDAMLNVGLDVQIVLGRTRMPIAELLKLSRGSIVELRETIGQPVDVVINDRLVARGDLVKLPDDRIGVSLIEIVKDYVSEG
ncbi:FliM/FliN family flagellar motor switch protein [Pseudooceanicola aestuarii]|uniref:FliM/FliN family flagellar motor switch protein n=1 Tax=Pseudooceanicola aestuarii TaxID=2697319 RepID=UPI0013D6DA65|nr:FliM/FliN family flagellar motor switch protein [Pseudooceanicola aestuarii]